MVIVKHVYGTTAEWASNDIVLYQGEIGVEKTTNGEHKVKVGDGVHAWSALPYFGITPSELEDLLHKISGGTNGNLVSIGANGEVVDSGSKASDFEPADPAIMKTDEDQTMTADLTLANMPDSDMKAAPRLYVDLAVARVSNAKHYTARWNKTSSALTRLNDAALITTDTTNFKHSGSVNPNYNNPFDKIYPWSGRKLCNIDIDAYMALTSGQSLLLCVKAWEGDADFSYSDANGVWVYTPEFWGKSWDDGTYRYFDVTDKPCGGYVHYRERIEGRWHGCEVTKTIGGTQKVCLLPTASIPADGKTLPVFHQYANNFGATLDTIFSVDATLLLLVVEYASMNSQAAIGKGVATLTTSTERYIPVSSEGTTVKVSKNSDAVRCCIKDAIITIGSSGNRFIIQSVEESGDYLNLTLDRAVSVSTSDMWYVHGLRNTEDASIGSMSGYIGQNGSSIAYYRGLEFWGNRHFFLLGAYKKANTAEVFVAHDDEEADAASTIDPSGFIGTGLAIAYSNSQRYINKLGLLSRSGLLSIPPFCTELGGSSSDPVGDYSGRSGQNTMPRRGGYPYSPEPYPGWDVRAGAFCVDWSVDLLNTSWANSARPQLKKP